MRLPCPHCGDRDLREFTCRGPDLLRPGPGGAPGGAPVDWGPDWDAYLHLRDNPAGPIRELWYHDPCGTWLAVTRDTASHVVTGSAPGGDGR